jgi:hypothetical protein
MVPGALEAFSALDHKGLSQAGLNNGAKNLDERAVSSETIPAILSEALPVRCDLNRPS